MAKIIAMMNQKGGVGKTTTSVNLAACLAASEQRTLLLDLDPQGNGSISIGLDKSLYSAANIYHAIIGEAKLSDCVYKSELPLFDVCPSDNNLSGAEIELVPMMARESKLKMALESVNDYYDYILIDCPPSLGLLTVNALNAADSFIVPMQTEYLAMEGLAQLMNTVNIIKTSLNPKLENDGILLTMFDSRSSLNKQVASEIRKHFADVVFETVIPRNVKLAECPSFGKPIILYDIESKGAEAYLSLAREVLIRQRMKDQANEVTVQETTSVHIPKIPENNLNESQIQH